MQVPTTKSFSDLPNQYSPAAKHKKLQITNTDTSLLSKVTFVRKEPNEKRTDIHPISTMKTGDSPAKKRTIMGKTRKKIIATAISKIAGATSKASLTPCWP